MTPSLTFGEDAYAVGDTLRFRLGPDDAWRRGYVLRLSAKRQALQVQPEEGIDRRPCWITPGKDGEVASLHGADLVEAQENGAPPPPTQRSLHRKTPLRRKTPLAPCRRRRELPVQADPGRGPDPAALPPIIARVHGALHAVPKPPQPARSPDYLAFVREHPCAACGAAAPSEAHHEGPRGVGQRCSDFRCVPLCHRCHRVRTDTGALPGLDQAESRDRLRQVQVELLVAWASWLADAEAAV